MVDIVTISKQGFVMVPLDHHIICEKAKSKLNIFYIKKKTYNEDTFFNNLLTYNIIFIWTYYSYYYYCIPNTTYQPNDYYYKKKKNYIIRR